MGKCAPCGKLVNLGRATETAKEGNPQKEVKAQTGQPPKEKPAAKPARAARRAPRPAPIGRPATERKPQPGTSDDLGSSVRAFFAELFNW